MLRTFFASLILIVIAVYLLAGFRGEKTGRTPIQIFPDMKVQPRYDAQHESTFYADGRAARAMVPGTVPQGYVQPGRYSTNNGNNARQLTGPAGFSNALDYVNTGRMGAVWGDGIPRELDVTAALMERGRQRFTVNCAVCHGATGSGNGIVSQYGLNGVADLHQARLRTMPDGQIFETITHGKGNMAPYGSNVTVEDRWAIIAYVRALQRSRNAKLDDVPADHRTDLEKP